MEILDGFGDLDDDVTAEVFTEIGQAHNLMEQLAPWTQFQNDIIVLARLGEFDQFDNIGVIELSHDLDLFQDVRALQQILAYSTTDRSEVVRSEEGRKV
jgi:hypothetical protein